MANKEACHYKITTLHIVIITTIFVSINIEYNYYMETWGGDDNL